VIVHASDIVELLIYIVHAFVDVRFLFVALFSYIAPPIRKSFIFSIAMQSSGLCFGWSSLLSVL